MYLFALSFARAIVDNRTSVLNYFKVQIPNLNQND